jgi:DNA-binding transcriptional ArsR family regulator
MAHTLLSGRISVTKLRGLTAMLKVIAHPVRLDIVDLLCNQLEANVLEIQSALELEQAMASQHLLLLQSKGVVKSRKVGRHRYFSLVYPRMRAIIDCMESCLHSGLE